MILYRKYLEDYSVMWEFLEIDCDDSLGKLTYQRNWRKGYATRAQAVEASRKIVDRNVPVTSAVYFSDLVRLWFEDYAKKVKGSTVLRAKSMFECHFLLSRMLGDFKVSEISESEIKRVIEVLISEVTKYKRCIYYLSQVFKFALEKEICNENPVAAIYVPGEVTTNKVVSPHCENFWEMEDLNKFMKIIQPKDLWKLDRRFVYFRLLAYTGMRNGELIALSWNDIDPIRHEIFIHKSASRDQDGKQIISDTTKTPSGTRIISIDSETSSILAAYRTLVCPKSFDEFIIPNSVGNMLSLTRPDTWLRRIIRRYKLKPISIHGFRHTFATLAFDAGIRVEEIQEQLGHSDSKTTVQTYIHITNRARKRRINRFHEYLRLGK
ncbi:site-specific integrase [Periweissella cryptocerci]|uniref:Site-specific integrase n=1 Tax=Periweissella cryptocerci TaxID=2506420 RepID=A0A4P6YWZ8_9LACO|nr:site-specific integrase [Periweissella cryptocerci]QBO37378.1 site-specific integrase [Periweissella cryptocerci]